MILEKFKYWKTNEVEDFFVFKAKIIEIEKYNEGNKNGIYNFVAEYIIEYPLSKIKKNIQGKGFIYHNLISSYTTKPTEGAIIELMARPNDLERNENWEIHLPVADDIKQEDRDAAKDFLEGI